MQHVSDHSKSFSCEGEFREGKPVDCRAKVLDFGNDEAAEYAILSHRWSGQEVNCDEMVGLAKMAMEEKVEIHKRDGYQKILQSCKQAQKDGYEQLWVDTCCPRQAKQRRAIRDQFHVSVVCKRESMLCVPP